MKIHLLCKFNTQPHLDTLEYRVGQQVKRLFSIVYAKICKLSWCRSTGQQAAFECVCQNNKKCKSSLCRSTGQQAVFECVCQNL